MLYWTQDKQNETPNELLYMDGRTGIVGLVAGKILLTVRNDNGNQRL